MSISPIFWLLAFIPALIALYFLKLKRQEKVVSSTLLWSRSLEELHVNAPFQKLRRSLLLLLQLLVLCGLIFALWRPRTTGEELGGRSVIVLLDVSASMAAREKDGTRLDGAKARATELVNTMNPGDRMALLTFAAKSRTLVPLTEDKNSLLGAIDEVEVTSAPTRLAQSLVYAGALAETLVDGEIHVLGDGCYGDLSKIPDEMKRLKVEFFSDGTALGNVAVTEMDVRQSFEIDRRAEILAVVENFSPEEWSGTVSFFFEDELHDARDVQIEAGKAESVTFDGSKLKDGVVRVAIEAEDVLDCDNEAWVRLVAPKPVNVLFVGPENFWIELIFNASESVDYRRVSLDEFNQVIQGVASEDLPAKLAADVVIFDRQAPPGPPVLPAIYIGCAPDTRTGSSSPDSSSSEEPAEDTPDGESRETEAEELVESPFIVDWDRTHPVNRFLVYTDLHIEKSRIIEPGENVRALLETDKGAIISTVTHRDPGSAPVPAVVIGFNVLDSNWPVNHLSFPIFFSNAVQWLHQQRQGSEKTRYRSGEPLIFRPDILPDDEEDGDGWSEVRFRSPGGEMITPGRDEFGSLVLASTTEVGLYEVVLGDQILERLPVGLLSDKESKLEPQEEISFGDYEVKVKTTSEKGMRDLWKWFAAAALAFLFIEWWVYNRRLGF